MVNFAIVFDPSSPFEKFVRNGNVKGGMVLTLSALEALNNTGALDSANVTVFLGGDEESPAEPVEVSRKELLGVGKSSEAAQVGFLDKSVTPFSVPLVQEVRNDGLGAAESHQPRGSSLVR